MHRTRAALALLSLAGLAACASSHAQKDGDEKPVSLAQVSAPARATIKRQTAGGHVDKITKETERGKTVYDVEATMGGKHAEYTIAESDGAILGTETEVAFSDLPQPVQAAAHTYFGTAQGLHAMKGVEYGETTYEITGMKGGKQVEVTFDAAGKQEKE